MTSFFVVGWKFYGSCESHALSVAWESSFEVGEMRAILKLIVNWQRDGVAEPKQCWKSFRFDG
jgi:hypothetical protein